MSAGVTELFLVSLCCVFRFIARYGYSRRRLASSEIFFQLLDCCPKRNAAVRCVYVFYVVVDAVQVFCCKRSLTGFFDVTLLHLPSHPQTTSFPKYQGRDGVNRANQNRTQNTV